MLDIKETIAYANDQVLLTELEGSSDLNFGNVELCLKDKADFRTYPKERYSNHKLLHSKLNTTLPEQ